MNSPTSWRGTRYLESRGVQNLYGSKDATRKAFETGLLENGAVWMDMVQSRNLTSHTYDEAIAARIAAAICDTYLAEFDALRLKLEALKKEEEG